MPQVMPTRIATSTTAPPSIDKRAGIPLAHTARVFAAIDFATWAFLLFLMLLQCLNAVVPSVQFNVTLKFGASPAMSPTPLAITTIPGNNDDPYIDRAMTCVLVGRVYKAATLADALNHSTVIRHPNVTADSYNVLVRPDPQTTLPTTRDAYDAVCSAIALTIDGIIHACRDQGYHPATDSLKINVGPGAAFTTELPSALPVLIMPFFDNGVIARYGLPGVDGFMCSVKLYGQYVGPGAFYQVNVMNRTDFDSRTRLWLGQPDGTWENGWFTFAQPNAQGNQINHRQFYVHMQYDMRRKDAPNGLGIDVVVYDAATSTIVDCEAMPFGTCECQVHMTWQGMLVQKVTELWSECVVIQDANRQGIIWYTSFNQQYLVNRFGVGAVVANLSVFGLLARWGIAMLALWRAHLYSKAPWHGCGLGIVSCSDSFVWLPVLLLPASKQIFLIFWASGIQFEGAMIVVADAWYIVYPALGQFAVLYFAVLNWLSKLLRVRSSDRLFGPLLLALCVGHYSRQTTFATLGEALGFTGRAQSLFFADSFRSASLLDVAFSQALLIGGNVKGIFVAKLVLLCLPLIDLLFLSHRVGKSCRHQTFSGRPCHVEITLAIRANYCGGLGKSTMYTPTGLNGYEMVRLGYLRFGKDNVISFDDYFVVIACYASQLVNETFNQRILVLELALDPSDSSLRFKQTMFRWNDPRFTPCSWLQVQSIELE